jgi:hypothetical protein
MKQIETMYKFEHVLKHYDNNVGKGKIVKSDQITWKLCLQVKNKKGQNKL